MAGAAGPLVGGALVDAAGWRWVFLVNVPIAVVIAVLLARHVPESRDDRAGHRFDVAGALLAAVGLGGVTYALIQPSAGGWAAAAVGLIAFAGFVWVERRSQAPMLSLVGGVTGWPRLVARTGVALVAVRVASRV